MSSKFDFLQQPAIRHAEFIWFGKLNFTHYFNANIASSARRMSCGTLEHIYLLNFRLLILVTLLLNACTTSSKSTRESLQGVWEYHPEIYSDTLTISDSFEPHYRSYEIQTDSGWYRHVYYPEDSILVIEKFNRHFCAEFLFTEDLKGQIHYFDLYSLKQSSFDSSEIINLFNFDILDSTITFSDAGSAGLNPTRELSFKLLNEDQLLLDDDTLTRLR